MSKRSKGKRQKAPIKRRVVADAEFRTDPLPTPLDRDAPPKMQRLYRAALGDAKAGFDEEATQLERAVRSMDPFQLLARMSVGHMYPAGFDPESSLPDPLTQWPLEWLQGFCLRFDLSDYRLGAEFDPVVAREIVGRLMGIGATSVAERYRRREERFGRAPSGQVDGSWEQEQARTARLAVRNWSYRPHMVAIVTRLCERLDDWSEAESGFRLSAIPALLFNVEEEGERRVNLQRRVVRAVVDRSSSPVGMCRRWQQSNLPGADLAYELEVDLQNRRISPAELFNMFYRTIEQQGPRHFTFTMTDLEALSSGQLTREALERLMPSLSYRFGELRKVEIEHLTLGNPAWTRPFIALDDGTCFCPLPSMGLSHLLDLVDNLIPKDEEDDAEEEGEEKQRWSRARSRFLEQRTREILEAAFPSATIHVNSRYDDPPVGIDLENDLAVVLDDGILVLEAKSHQVPSGVWRGAPGGMRTSIEKLVLEPSIQSQNFANYLLRTKGPRSFRSKAGAEFVIDSSGIRSAVRANVVLDPFPVVRNLNFNLREARLLRDDDPEPVPTLLLSTLEAVLVLFPDELQRLHYLARRQILQNHCLIHAEEHDLLALYIETGLNLPALEDTTNLLVFRALAKKHIDPYLEQWFTGKGRLPRPVRRLQPRWLRMLNRLQAERPPDWVTIGMALLDASAKQQQEMLERTTRAVTTIAETGTPRAIEWWSMDVGLSFWRSTIVGVVARESASDDPVTTASSLVKQYRLNTTSSCTVLLFDVSVDRKAPVALIYIPAEDEAAT